MKLLRCLFCFELSDDFDGGFTEALEELIAYRKSKGYTELNLDSEGRTITMLSRAPIKVAFDEVYD